MSTSERSGISPVLNARATQVSVNEDVLNVRLEDGRSILVPIAWFPRLLKGTKDQRSKWELFGDGIGIHWPDLDEHISVANLLATRGEDLLIYHETADEPSAEHSETELPQLPSLGEVQSGRVRHARRPGVQKPSAIRLPPT
jgi:hypothetical protein